MKKILEIQMVSEYSELLGVETYHPLVNVVNLNNVKRVPVLQPISFGFYSVLFKTGRRCAIRYGRNSYDYQSGTLIFIAPGQFITIEDDKDQEQPDGYALYFHPDLLRGTALGKGMQEYNFFSYDVHEALHLSEKEKEIVIESLKKIEYELAHAIDKHSKKLIVSNIELFLNYCTRFFDRQFTTRDYSGLGVLEKFDSLLNEYMFSDRLERDGMPPVSYFAKEFNLSPNYFGDLIKKETGKTPLEHIQAKLIAIAKEKVININKTVGEVAYELGFHYPQHFTRFFKKQVGCTPHEFRNLN